MSGRRFVDFVHGVIMFFGAGGSVAAYWLAYFGSDMTKAGLEGSALTMAEYMAYENAFPLPDAVMAACFAIAAVLLWGRDRAAPFWAFIASGMMLFLALIDINFNLINGLYANLATDSAIQIETAINVACLALALWTWGRMWNHPLRIGRQDY